MKIYSEQSREDLFSHEKDDNEIILALENLLKNQEKKLNKTYKEEIKSQNYRVIKFIENNVLKIAYTEDKDLVKSNRMFLRFLRIYKEMQLNNQSKIKEGFEEIKTSHKLLQHNISKLAAKINQELEYTLPSVATGAPTIYDISNYIKHSDSKMFAKTLKKVQLWSHQIEGEIAVFNFLNLGTFEPKIRRHEIHKLAYKYVQLFNLDMEKSNIKINIFDCKEKVEIDYDSVSAVFFHIFSNINKYCKPNSTCFIKFKSQKKEVSVSFEMESSHIQENELEMIKEKGKRGKNIHDRSGDGMGLYVIEQLMQQNNGSFEIYAGKEIKEKIGIRKYSENKFILKFPKYSGKF